MTTLNFTGNVRRMRLRPGDTIVIEAAENVTANQAGEIKAAMQEAYPDNPCMVLGGGLKVAAVLRREDLEVVS